MSVNLLWLGLIAALLAPPAGAPSPSPEVRRQIDLVVAARARAILSEKDAAGLASRRAAVSRDYTAAGDGAWRTRILVDTAAADALTTRAFDLTLGERTGSAGWAILEERPAESYTALRREVPGDEVFLQFDGFALQREGMTARASSGWMYEDFFMGRASRLVVVAPDLSWDARPPLPGDRLMLDIIRKDHPQDLLFQPDRIVITGDPASCEAILATAFTNLRPAAGDPDAALAGIHQDDRKAAEKRRRDDPFADFRRPEEPDRRWFDIAAVRRGGDARLSLRYDSVEPREVSLVSSTLGRLFCWWSEATRAGGASPLSLERRPAADARDYDLEAVSGTVDLGFGDGERLSGDLTFTLKPRRPLREIPFEMARLSEARGAVDEARAPRMRIDRLRDGAGRDLLWVATGPTEALVILGETAAAGATLTIRMKFENDDAIIKFTPYYFFVDRAGWLPFVHYGDMIGRFDLAVRVPRRFKALCSGGTEPAPEGDATVTRCASGSPVSFPTVIFGGYDDVPARVRTLSKDGAPIPIVVHVDKDSLSSIRSASLPGLADQAAQCLDLYQRLFDAGYPYGRLDLVNDPTGALSGQAPSSLVFFGSGYYVAKGPGQITKAEIERASRTLVPHEVAHQWWGSLVSSAGPAHGWLEEALAEYSSALFLQAASGRDAYLTRVGDWRREAIESFMPAPVQDARLVWTDGWRGYHAATYAKGPYLLHMMRSIWGDDRFFEFLKRMASEHRGREIVTRDMQRTAEKVFGEPLDWFFDQWVRGTGIPEFTFTRSVAPAPGGGYAVEGRVEQRILASPRLAPKRVLEGRVFECVVYVSVTGRSGREYQQRLDIKDRVTPFRFTVPEKPAAIELDKYGETLAHDVIVE